MRLLRYFGKRIIVRLGSDPFLFIWRTARFATASPPRAISPGDLAAATFRFLPRGTLRSGQRCVGLDTGKSISLDVE
jgi:hypothetical protein